MKKSGDSSSYWDLLKNKWTILYFLGIFCYVGAEQGVGNWISQFLYQYHGLDAQNCRSRYGILLLGNADRWMSAGSTAIEIYRQS